MTPTPPPPDALLGLPLAVWTNLPLFLCLVFGAAILIGFLFIVRENRRVAAKNRLIEEDQA
jgi:hypothetical protein